jgi:sugar phosphate isomerase/epimerase
MCDLIRVHTMQERLSRRSFFGLAAAAPLVAAVKQSPVPVGLELYSVRGDMDKDLMGTVKAVCEMGYQCVEFYSPYFSWKPEYAKEVRKLLDDHNVKCYSTHNGPESYSAAGISKAIELNQILGARYIVLASAGNPKTLDGWKKVADLLNAGNEKFAAAGMHAGYHNHQLEFKPLDGKRPIEVIAANTDKSVALQMDVGTVVEVGADPVAWINANPGRIKSIHCKEYSKNGKGYKVLFGDGDAPWKAIFAAAEKTGGIEFYLIEQEGSDLSELESAKRCLANFKKIYAS